MYNTRGTGVAGLYQMPEETSKPTHVKELRVDISHIKDGYNFYYMYILLMIGLVSYFHIYIHELCRMIMS